jgi:hypothetical protein
MIIYGTAATFGIIFLEIFFWITIKKGDNEKDETKEDDFTI